MSLVEVMDLQYLNMDVYVYSIYIKKNPKTTDSHQQTISKDFMNFIIWGGGV